MAKSKSDDHELVAEDTILDAESAQELLEADDDAWLSALAETVRVVAPEGWQHRKDGAGREVFVYKANGKTLEADVMVAHVQEHGEAPPPF